MKRRPKRIERFLDKLGTELTRARRPDPEIIGEAIAEFLNWDGLAVLRVAHAGLEGANFHTESKVIDRLIESLRRDTNPGLMTVAEADVILGELEKLP